MADPKTNKLKARLPRGLADRGPAEIAATRDMLATIRKVYELYGFEPVETPAIEYTDALGKFLPDQDRPNEGVFSFKDDDEQWLSLRYDLTAPLARYVAENFDRLPKPYRSYREGYVFRNEKPGPGRFRQFMQFDADTVGSASMVADAEICMMAADTMEALGIPHGSYVVKVSNRKLLDGLMATIGIGGEEHAAKRLTVLRAIDKLDRLGVEGVRLLLGSGRKDESGDFTKGAELSESQIHSITDYLGTLVHGEDFSQLQRQLSLIERSEVGFQGLSELEEITKYLQTGGYGKNQFKIDPSVVRGLEYYTGPVYEVELTFPITGDDGKPVRFGSVAGGGRYDGLVARFRGEPVPATGFSIGVSRLLAALMHLRKVKAKPKSGPVVITVLDKDRLDDYQRMVTTLRKAGIHAELYLGPGRFGPQMKYADRRGSPCVVIQGADEKQRGEVQIKDLIVGAELAGLSNKRDDYLKKQAEAQFSVPGNQLVEAVRKVLARHGMTSQANLELHARKSVPHPLDGCWAKIERAREQIDNLEIEITALVNSGAYTVVRENQLDRHRYAFKLLGPPVPFKVSVVAGEIIHHLRSSFDHVVWALADRHDLADERIQFPVCNSQEKFEEAIKKEKIKDISLRERSLIEALQPYSTPDPNNSILRIIHDLDIVDKHRLLVVVTHAMTIGNVLKITKNNTTDPTFGIELPSATGYPWAVEDGIEVHWIPLRGTNEEFEMETNYVVHIAFEKVGALQRQPVVPVLRQLCAWVEGAIHSFDQCF